MSAQQQGLVFKPRSQHYPVQAYDNPAPPEPNNPHKLALDSLSQGLNQVDISLTAALAGGGESDVVLTVNGQTANTVTLSIQ